MAAQAATAAQSNKTEVQGLSEVQQRRKRRADYLGEVGKRNDAPLLLGLTLAFLGPAAIILAIAFSTGACSWGLCALRPFNVTSCYDTIMLASTSCCQRVLEHTVICV
jgi:hypothetical protein